MTNTTILVVTDKTGTSGTVTVDKDDVAATIGPWYPDAPQDVTDALADLQAALNRGEWDIVNGLAATLGIDLSPVTRYRIAVGPGAAALAHDMNDPSYGLTANGRRVTVDGDNVEFSPATLDYLREHITENYDGYVAPDDQGRECIWIGGDCYPIEAV